MTCLNVVCTPLVGALQLQRNSGFCTHRSTCRAFGVSSSLWDFAKQILKENLQSHHYLLSGLLQFVPSLCGVRRLQPLQGLLSRTAAFGRGMLWWCLWRFSCCQWYFLYMLCVTATEKRGGWYSIWIVLMLIHWFVIRTLIGLSYSVPLMPGTTAGKLSRTSFEVIFARNSWVCCHLLTFLVPMRPWSFPVRLLGSWTFPLACTKLVRTFASLPVTPWLIWLLLCGFGAHSMASSTWVIELPNLVALGFWIGSRHLGWPGSYFMDSDQFCCCCRSHSAVWQSRGLLLLPCFLNDASVFDFGHLQSLSTTLPETGGNSPLKFQLVRFGSLWWWLKPHRFKLDGMTSKNPIDV